jgi:hypothetical protein
MRVAVLSLTRDRLDYTKHCFATLEENAGCDFDHYVLDQGSSDGTPDWLAYEWRRRNYHRHTFVEAGTNLGIHRGWNHLRDLADVTGRYDFYVTFDNDCEVTIPDTLRTVCETAGDDWILSPRVEGLLNPPRTNIEMTVRHQRVGPYPAIGGIFRALPARFMRMFRFNEASPIWGKDEGDVGQAASAHGFGMGYLLDWSINHFETTAGQQAKYPDYFARKFAEMT